MANIIRIKRRAAGGSAGAPSSLKTSEIAYNEQDDILYIGYGDDGSGNATSIRAFAGMGAVLGRSGDQSVSGVKTFSSFPVTPSSAPTDNYQVANKKYVDDSVSGAGGGDMLASVYDPGEVEGDVFDMDNMVEGTDTKIMTGAERTKLSGIASGATANSADATLLARANHTGTQSADTITDGSTNKAFTGTEKTKLAGIEAAADVTDATNVAAAGAFMKATDDADDISEGSTNKLMTASERSKLSGIEASADVTDAANVGAAIHGASTKTTPVNADKVAIIDSEASNILKTITYQNLVNAVATLISDGAPGALDTLNEIAAALNDDSNFAGTVTTALAAKAPLASPTFTGTPAAPTASGGTNTTQIATTAFVQAAVATIDGGTF